MSKSTTKSASKAVWNLLLLSLLPLATSVPAACITNPPEIGDIGPDSELVCRQLGGRFASADLAILDRTVHSPNDVTVDASVHGMPVQIRYELIGYSWRPTLMGQGIAGALRPEVGLSMGE